MKFTKFKNFEKNDMRIFIGALIILFLSSALIWKDAWIYSFKNNQNSTYKTIGIVQTNSSDVRRKNEDEFSWTPIRDSFPLFQGDSIFTGANSEATIVSDTGEKISVASNSMVVFSQKDDIIRLNIGFGSAIGKIAKGKTLIVTTDQGVTEITGTNATIRIDAGSGNKLIIGVIQGEAKIKALDGDKNLKTDEILVVNSSGRPNDVAIHRINILEPSNKQVFQQNTNKPISFLWSSTQNFNRMKIKISKSPDFSNLVVDQHVDEASYSAYDLPIDIPLYWKIISEGGASEVQQLTVVGNMPPVPTAPLPGHQYYFDPLSSQSTLDSKVILEWRRGSITNQYEIQISNNMIFQNDIQTYKSRSTNLTLNNLMEGEYYWRVRSADFENQRWSDPSLFKVGPKPTQILAPPMPQMAENIFLIKTKKSLLTAFEFSALTPSLIQRKILNFPILKWSEVEHAEKYMLQLSKDGNFNSLLLTALTDKPTYKLNNVTPGKYYWRIKAVSTKAKSAIFSLSQELNVAVAPPISITNDVYTDEVPDPELLTAKPPPLTIRWAPTVFAQFYEVEFSSSSNFVNSNHFITNSSEKVIQLASQGINFWRVRSLDKKQMPISPFSNSNTLEYQRIYRDPEDLHELTTLSPKPNDSLVFVGQKNYSLFFKWNNKFPEAKYRIEISYDPKFEIVAQSELLTASQYKYQERFTSPIVYWRVRAENTSFVSDWTKPSRFNVTYENVPYDLEQSDLIFQARLKARERQKVLYATQLKRIAHLRTPASLLETQLETPRFKNIFSQYTIESNLNDVTQTSNIKMANINDLTKLPTEHYFSLIKSYPIITWERVPAAEIYFIEIAQDPNFLNSIIKTPCFDPHYTWDTVRPGKFYYRVQAFNDRYTRSHYSEPQNLEVTVANPEITSKDVYAETFTEPKVMWPPPAPFQLSWTPVLFAKNYELEFSEDRTFQTSKVFKTSSTSIEMRVSHPNTYYWRLRPVNSFGIGISPFTGTRSVEIIQANRKPAAENYLTGLFPVNRTILFVGNGLMHLAFHWIDAAKASEYRIEIANSASFSNILTSKVVNELEAKNSEALITKNLPDGKLFWRIVTNNKQSEINSFELRHEH